jgi:hypothetical protein
VSLSPIKYNTGKGLRGFLVHRILLPLSVVLYYFLHQDVWFWRTARPLVFGFIPIGLFYHACYSVGAALLMWLLVKYAWPTELETEAEEDGDKEARD